MFSHLFFDSVYEVPSSSKCGALSAAALPGLGEQVTFDLLQESATKHSVLGLQTCTQIKLSLVHVENLELLEFCDIPVSQNHFFIPDNNIGVLCTLST